MRVVTTGGVAVNWPADSNNDPLTGDEVVDLAVGDGDKECEQALRDLAYAAVFGERPVASKRDG